MILSLYKWMLKYHFIKFNTICKDCAIFHPGANSPLKLVRSRHKMLLNKNSGALAPIWHYYNFLSGVWMKYN